VYNADESCILRTFFRAWYTFKDLMVIVRKILMISKNNTLFSNPTKISHAKEICMIP